MMLVEKRVCWRIAFFYRRMLPWTAGPLHDFSNAIWSAWSRVILLACAGRDSCKEERGVWAGVEAADEVCFLEDLKKDMVGVILLDWEGLLESWFVCWLYAWLVVSEEEKRGGRADPFYTLSSKSRRAKDVLQGRKVRDRLSILGAHFSLLAAWPPCHTTFISLFVVQPSQGLQKEGKRALRFFCA